MANLFNFNDLKQYTRVAKCSVDEIAAKTDISYDGLKRGLQNESLSIRFVVPLCQALNMTPNQFFGVEETSGDTNYGNMQKNAKKQIMQVGTEELKKTISILEGQLKTKDEQLKSKDEQLAAKDVQINKLLGI